MGMQTNRRALLGAAMLTPIVTTCGASAVTAGPIDNRWRALVADYRARYAAWFATIDLEDQAVARFREANIRLPSEPVMPRMANEGILDRTIRQIRDAGENPEYKAQWAAYERDLEAWQKQCQALRQTFTGPAKARYEETFAARADAFEALTSYRVTNLRDLAEKIEIVQHDFDGCDVPPEFVADFLADARALVEQVRA